MPRIFDNIEQDLLEGLKDALQVSGRLDICVGYFNLRGWKCISDEINALPSDDASPACRMIVGMTSDVNRIVKDHYSYRDSRTTQRMIIERKRRFAEGLARQLTYGVPTAQDEVALQKLAGQLKSGRLIVKFFGGYPLHAKLYLAHREDKINPIIGFLGSSNLTLSGLIKQGELNIDVLDGDAAGKLADWFEERWNDKWCLDISQELAEIVENSWAGGPISPYEIYIKTAYELSREAIAGSLEFKVPAEFQKVMLEFQKQAVSIAAERLEHRGGVIIGDVVGLGKTLVASALAKTFQEDRGDNVLVICPPKLEAMWEGYMADYLIAGTTLSIGKTAELQNMRRYRLIIIDESHNLRNRESKRYAHIHDYIRDNASRVILLTATPYNKQFTDIGSQLRLFVEADSDLGVRPEDYIGFKGGADGFKKDHPNTVISSLAAFEQSDSVDDWRELMRMFMVRRTRSHIKKNYAKYDEERKQHYLTFSDGERYYFPDRVPKCVKFSLDGNDRQDQYGLLYSESVVKSIENLNLPRYGIAQYLHPEYAAETLPASLSEDDKVTIGNLSRAGKRLIGFARSGMFKRLESSGTSFLLSVRRHIIRNTVYMSACEDESGSFPIGGTFSPFMDEETEDIEQDLADESLNTEHKFDYFKDIGRRIYEEISTDKASVKKFKWISAKFFKSSLAIDLEEDCRSLLEILEKVPKWNADTDRKLAALTKLCNENHGKEKLLIFTQFKDTADYIYGELRKRLPRSNIAETFGGMDDIAGYVKRFSPSSNNAVTEPRDELRVLITTDTLSEGQNLQDAHIVVNFDLPWAIIRLVQRAGRVDRIGQKSAKILCYCFMPEDGIETILNLRGRLQNRIKSNAELIGSDERFFEGNKVDLKQIYEETISLEEQEDETDLISHAYDIWRQAIENNPSLEKRIKTLQDAVYSAKRTLGDGGVISYIKTDSNIHTLALVNEEGEVISQSQSKLLDMLACPANEPTEKISDKHHDLTSVAVQHSRKGEVNIGGQLGNVRSIRHRVYTRLKSYLEQNDASYFGSEDLRHAIEVIYKHPLKETARDKLARQMRYGISDEALADMVVNIWGRDDLCAIPATDQPIEHRIVCSMGLIPRNTAQL